MSCSLLSSKLNGTHYFLNIETIVKNFCLFCCTYLLRNGYGKWLSIKSVNVLLPDSGLRKHDVCFLITVRPTQPYGTKFDRRRPFVEQTGLVYVRGCEIQGMLDEKGRVIEEGMDISKLV